VDEKRAFLSFDDDASRRSKENNDAFDNHTIDLELTFPGDRKKGDQSIHLQQQQE
jgi:hypothetical protein